MMWSRTRSLLRYSGSKARFAKFIARTLRLNGLRENLFVEPFCGGATVSIALLEESVVAEIALNDERAFKLPDGTVGPFREGCREGPAA